MRECVCKSDYKAAIRNQRQFRALILLEVPFKYFFLMTKIEIIWKLL